VQLVTSVLLEYLAQALGSNLSGDGGDAWTKLFGAFVDVADAEIKRIDGQ
jgi:hypothetical protein